MKLTLGTKLYADFPTTSGIIYTREAIIAVIQASEQKILDGLMVGGVFDEESPFVPKENRITHKVTNIFLYNNEIAVEIDTLEDEDTKRLIDTIKHKKAALVTKLPAKDGDPGSTVRKINSIECIHIREDKECSA